MKACLAMLVNIIVNSDSALLDVFIHYLLYNWCSKGPGSCWVNVLGHLLRLDDSDIK